MQPIPDRAKKDNDKMDDKVAKHIINKCLTDNLVSQLDMDNHLWEMQTIMISVNSHL
jgi:hypothetical protein